MAGLVLRALWHGAAAMVCGVVASALAMLLVVAGVALAAEPLTVEQKAVVRSLSLSELGPLPPDPSNRFADLPGAAAFGATLFFDARLSRDGSVSCSSCHRLESQFQDDLPRAVGIGQTNRRTLPLAGVARNRWFFWDGRRDSLWAQALVPLEDPLEHGGTRTFYAHVMANHLRERYEHVFGPLPNLENLPASAGPLGNARERAAWEAMSETDRRDVDRLFSNLGKAFAAFERSLEPPDTRFDRFAASLQGGGMPETDAILSATELQGLDLFTGKAGCVRCHSGPLFTDGAFHNTGVAGAGGIAPDFGRESGVAGVMADPFNCLGKFSDASPEVCAALRSLTASDAVRGAFKTPSLRGAATRPPYMHAGQIETLEAVVNHYARAPASPEGVSELRPIALSASERAALVAFLRTLAD